MRLQHAYTPGACTGCPRMHRMVEHPWRLHRMPLQHGPARGACQAPCGEMAAAARSAVAVTRMLSLVPAVTGAVPSAC
jgi:hypothetical protein